jgi:hypothetical protein
MYLTSLSVIVVSVKKLISGSMIAKMQLSIWNFNPRTFFFAILAILKKSSWSLNNHVLYINVSIWFMKNVSIVWTEDKLLNKRQFVDNKTQIMQNVFKMQ